jgi:hypothetical protein
LKKFNFLIVGMLLVAVCGGLYLKTGYSHIDFNDNAQLAAYDFQTGYIDEDTWEYTQEQAESAIENADAVMLVRCDGNRQVITATLVQNVEVLKVYRGDVSLEGKEIEIFNTDEVIRMYEDANWISGSTNFMENAEYLVFVNHMMISPGISKTAYQLANGTEISYFKVADGANQIVDLPQRAVEGVGGLYYEDVQNNEFFVKNQSVLDDVLAYKKEVLARYGLD